MLSMLHQRSGYAATCVMESHSKSILSYDTSFSKEDDTTCTETLGTSSPCNLPQISSTIDARLRSVIGPIWTEKQLLEKFTFDRLIGSGATAKVYAAMDHELNQPVSIKVFDKASMIEVRRSMIADGAIVSEKAIHRVRRRLLKIISELEISKSLQHPSIIQYLGAYETEYRICIVYEYIDGCDLLEYLLIHGKMNEDQAAIVLNQLLQALAYCHEQHVYHRDLKLENILITNDYQVKLIDFGLSEQLNDGQTLQTICGTPLYCAPEVLFMYTSKEKGFEGGPADVWSIGILLFALITGCAPFDDSNFTRLRKDVHQHRIAYPGYLSNTVKGLLKLILIFDPTLRPTVKDLLTYEWIQNAQEEKKEEINVWTPTTKGNGRTWSTCDTVTTSASSRGSFEDEIELQKISEEPQDISYVEQQLLLLTT